MSDVGGFTQPLIIYAGHPCLPGHFPGQPVVPGVVLLDHVAAVLERGGLGHFARITVVKFLAPLLPGEQAEMTVTRSGARVRFRIERGGSPIMTGEGELA